MEYLQIAKNMMIRCSKFAQIVFPFCITWTRALYFWAKYMNTCSTGSREYSVISPSTQPLNFSIDIHNEKNILIAKHYINGWIHI